MIWLGKLVPEALARVDRQLIVQFYDTVSEYEHACRNGHGTLTIESALKSIVKVYIDMYN